MKALQIIENNKYQIATIDIPTISDDEVLVKVAFVGICGSDYPRIWGGEARYYPIVLGHEFSGIIENIGKNVTNIQIGDRVAIAPLSPCMVCKDCTRGFYSQCPNYSFIGSRRNGALAEYVSVPTISIVKIDEQLSLQKAAYLEPITVGLHGLSLLDGDFTKKRIGLVGIGSIGMLTMQSLLASGATDITVLDIDDYRLEQSKKDRTIKTINLKNTDIKTIERNFDLVIETAGTVLTTKLCLQLADARGTVLYIGTPHAPVEFSLSEWEQINRKELTLKGSWMNYSAPYPGEAWSTAQKWLLEDKITINTGSIVISLEELPDKLKQVQNKLSTDKIIVKMS